eukprot:2656473-Alexandrium_andersonii.AAC.1
MLQGLAEFARPNRPPRVGSTPAACRSSHCRLGCGTGSKDGIAAPSAAHFADATRAVGTSVPAECPEA